MTDSNLERCNTDYYSNKTETLKDVFGTEDIILEKHSIVINGESYPVVDDVIILLDSSQYPSSVSRLLNSSTSTFPKKPVDIAEDIQFTFGAEWLTYPDIMPEHEDEFALYFDLINISDLKDLRVCDLGCGIGRWSYFLKDHCRELVLVDFSEAIFVARRNLASADDTLFFMGDLANLPFRNKFADFLFCLGVLHHLPTSAIDQVRMLRKYAPKISVYLYYALDNRPYYYRIILSLVTILRLKVSRIRSPIFREVFTRFCAIGLYLPLVMFGKLLRPFGLSFCIPLYEGYQGKSLSRIRQDVYDRFFTRIEQRFSHKQIMALTDTFAEIIISDRLPYWHFVCKS
jgi:SAM-dependent methyltransferase